MARVLEEILFKSNTWNILLSALLVICAFGYLQWRRSRAHLYKLAKTIFTPSELYFLPILGHGHYFIGNTTRVMKALEWLMKFDTKPFKLWFGPMLYTIVMAPEDMKIIYNSPHTFEKDDAYSLAKPLVGEGLFTASINKWRLHKKAIVPAFNQNVLNGFRDVLVEQTDILMGALKKIPAGKTFDMYTVVALCTLDMVCECTMGVKVNAQTTKSKYAENVNRVVELMAARCFNILLFPDIIYKLTSNYKKEKQVLKEIDAFNSKVLLDKRKLYADMKKAQENETFFEKPKRSVILELLMEASNDGVKFTDQELKDEVNTFMVAGFDATATIASFVLLLLALHPDEKEKVLQETLNILGEDRQFEAEDFPKFVYLDRVIKETMRLFPSGPVVGRKVEQDVKLDSCTIPKGSGVMLHILGMHRSPKYYDNPLVFNPDRFLPEEVAKRHPYAYSPFTLGPRKCVGFKFGYMMVTIIVANIIRKFHVETEYKDVEDIQLQENAIVKTVRGFLIRLNERKL